LQHSIEYSNACSWGKTIAADRAQGNSEPASYYAVSGRVERVIALRFKYNTDLLAGLDKMVESHLSD